MKKLNFLNIHKENINKYIYSGSFLFIISLLDVSLNSFFGINIVFFLPDFISFFLPLVVEKN